MEPPDISSRFDRSPGMASFCSTSTDIDTTSTENATTQASIAYSSYCDSKVETCAEKVDPLNESDEQAITPAIKRNIDIDISGYSTDEESHFRVGSRKRRDR